MRKGLLLNATLIAGLSGALSPCTYAAGQSTRNPQQSFASVLQQYPDEGWIDPRGGQRRYLWDQNNPGWKARMLALQALVTGGRQSLEPLLDALKSGPAQQRILAAQALGFLAPAVPRQALLRAIENDDDAAVRLYAVDSLGMQGGRDPSEELGRALANESNGDVKKHAGYARQRGDRGLDPSIVKDLTSWDPATIDSARLGRPAPDFRLRSLTDGSWVELSQFRGKTPVVLVFIYGDT